MFYNLLNKSSTNGTVDATQFHAELTAMIHLEATEMFFAVVAIMTVVGLIGYATPIPKAKAAGIVIVTACLVASAAFYVLPGIIHEIKIVSGW